MNIFRRSLLTIATGFRMISAFSQCEESAQILWGHPNLNSVTATDATYTAERALLICGNTIGRGMIAKFDKNLSAIFWSKTYTTGNYTSFTKVVAMNNGDIAVCGIATEGARSAILVMRTTSLGNPIWSKRLDDISSVPGLTNQFLIIRGMGETPDGGIVICGSKSYKRPDGNYNYRTYVFKIGFNGSIDWTREDTQGNDDDAYDLVVDQGQVIITGTSYLQSSGIRYGFIEKIDPQSGGVTFFKRYQLGALDNNFFRSIRTTASGYELGTQAFAVGKRIYNKLRTDFSGNQVDCKMLTEMGPNLVDQYYCPVPTNDGSSFLWRDDFYSSPDIELSKLTATGNVEWNYRYTHAGKQSIACVLPDNNSLIAVGTSPDPSLPAAKTLLFLLKIKPDGHTDNCVNDALPLASKDSLVYVVTQGSWQTTTLNFAPPFDYNVVAEDLALTSIPLCSGGACQPSGLSIFGDSIVCTENGTKTYKLRLNNGCHFSPQWSLSSPVGSIQTIDDSTIVIQFSQPGTAILRADFSTACADYSAQLQLSYYPSSITLDIGEDTSICTGQAVTLSVNAPFSFIEWTDGSHSNSISVTAPGTYAVAVSQDGFCFQHDSVDVIHYPLPEINLPNIPTICRPGSIRLTPGNWFKSYLWQDGSTGPDFIVADTGRYWVRVSDFNNCQAADTLIVNRIANSPVNFVPFRDTAICPGEKIVLYLNQSFESYNWDNGISGLKNLEVNRPGSYTIEVKTEEGCTGSDIIVVDDKDCKQVLYVPTAFTPNADGKNDIFKATAFAVVESFDLRVYNRWGELVFQSRDVSKGWNGRYKERALSSDLFVWFVEYRFYGTDKVLRQKGTVTLVL